MRHGRKKPSKKSNLDLALSQFGIQIRQSHRACTEKTELQTSRDPAIFAIGDCCACTQGEGQPAVPPRAQAAHQQASLLAKSLIRMLNGKELLTYRYTDHGSLVSLGNYSTVGSLMGALASGSIFIEGTIAKWMYWSLHKHHQVVVYGWFHTWLATWVASIDRVRNPRIKLH